MGVAIEFPVGTVALVTGASRGIGRATAERLAEAGATVVVNFRTQEAAAKEVVASIEGAGGQAVAVQADVSQEPDVRRLFKVVRAELGRLDVLVANAGITADGFTPAMSASKFDDVVATNLRGTFLTCRDALKLMVDQRSGAIVTVASTSGLAGVPGQANYCAAKGGILSMTRAIADEAARYQVRANVVAPGYIETDMSHAIAPTLRAFYRERIPLQRFAEPSEVADLILFLSSSLASYVTGACVQVDGGLII